jgi:hypothetical protein
MKKEIDLRSSDISIKKVEKLNWLLTIAMSVAGAVCFDLEIAKAVLIGGLIANISFFFMKRDLTKAMQGALESVKKIFLFKYYVRLTTLALILYFLIKYGQLSIIGLILGLSSVVISICFTAINELRKESVSKKNNDTAIAEVG